jgi:hypothetical protein
MTILVLITIVSLIAAVAMGAVAWRLSNEARQRSDARVAALARDIHDIDLDLSPGSDPGHLSPGSDPFGTKSVPQPAELFAIAHEPASSGPRFAVAAAIGVIVVGAVATMGLLLSAESRPSHAAAANHAAAPTAPVPLELLALGHERDGDRLIVRGVVRNPAGAAAVDGLSAVVFLFKDDGGFIASGRAAVEAPRLDPGAESRFVVAMPPAGDVRRYRVSFRTDDRVVPHIDRRDADAVSR